MAPWPCCRGTWQERSKRWGEPLRASLAYRGPPPPGVPCACGESGHGDRERHAGVRRGKGRADRRLLLPRAHLMQPHRVFEPPQRRLAPVGEREAVAVVQLWALWFPRPGPFRRVFEVLKQPGVPRLLSDA